MSVRLCVRMAKDEREGNVSGQSPLPLLLKQQQEEQSSKSGVTSFYSSCLYLKVCSQFQENSITEESEDDVFTEEPAAMDTEEDMEDEVEIATNKDDNGVFHKVLDWTTSDVVSVDNDISGVEPLEMTTDSKVRFSVLVTIFLLICLFDSNYCYLHLRKEFQSLSCRFSVVP